MVTSDWQPENSLGIAATIQRLKRELPGWWWSIGACSVSADATIGPDRSGPDYKLLDIIYFDAGIRMDLSQPASVDQALDLLIDHALECREIAKQIPADCHDTNAAFNQLAKDIMQ